MTEARSSPNGSPVNQRECSAHRIASERQCTIVHGFVDKAIAEVKSLVETHIQNHESMGRAVLISIVGAFCNAISMIAVGVVLYIVSHRLPMPPQ